ncbi:MCE family protein [Nocardioides sp.]|jgi:virulence factor Mce-like protein|uniref:MCE family protein n=1 Tax=Nocardioides sp. TaxID=35761 RepID=UPI00261EB150|nr:MCE family protein [Nocardioides sp.]
MSNSRGSIRYPLLGLLALSMGVAGVGLTFASYQKVFADTVMVEVRLERAEEQLDRQADVKVNGVRVGEVKELSPTAEGDVLLSVALDRELAAKVPADVTARLVPKTLFGEKYVELVPQGADDSIRAGTVIAQDMTRRSVRLQEVFDSLDPLLRTVRPADLNAATSSLAFALAGNGADLGRTLDSVAAYAGSARTFLPDLEADLTLLADVAAVYARVAPRLLGITGDAVTTISTVRDEIGDVAAALRGTSDVSGRVRVLLEENEETLVGLMESLRPTLALLEEYSPEFDCVFNGAKLAIQRIYDVFGGDDGPFVIRGRLRLGQTRGVYPRGFAPNEPLQAKLLEELKAFGPSCPVVTDEAIGGTPNADIPAPALALIGSYRGLLGLPATPLDTGQQQEQEQEQDGERDPLPGLDLPQGLLDSLDLPLPESSAETSDGLLSPFFDMVANVTSGLRTKEDQ